MYISHKYKLIFLRTPKTASSSLSEFFIKNIPDPDAIYTPVEDSKIRGTLDQSIINKYKLNFKYYHFTLEDLVHNNLITPEQIREYKSVAVIRNPIDRQKSFYYFYKRWKGPNKPASIEEYKSWTRSGSFINEPNSAIRQSSILTYGDNICGEYWLYENINNSLQNLMNMLKLDIKYSLPNHKNNFRTDKQNEIQFDEEAMRELHSAFVNDFTLYNNLRANFNVGN